MAIGAGGWGGITTGLGINVYTTGIDNTVSELHQVGEAVRGVGTVTGRTDVTTRGWVRTLRGLRNMMIAASISSFVMQLVMRGTEHATLRITELEERYAETVRERGRYSREAIRIERRLNLARSDAAKAQFALMVQIATTVPSMALQLAYTILQMKATWGSVAANVAATGSTVSLTAAIWNQVIALKAKAVAWAAAHPLAAAAVVAGAAVAAGAVVHYTRTVNVDVDITGRDIGDAMDEARRKAVRDYRSQSPP